MLTFQEVLEQGKTNDGFKVVEPKRDDCFMFSYTSGTTGDPKGVMLRQIMCVMTSAAVNMRFGALKLGEDDTYISYLPAAHSFE